MYASDNMQLCMNKYLLCMQVILVFMHGSMFVMHQNLQFFFFFFFLSMDKCLSYFMDKCLPCDKDAYSIFGH
jgi:hypothetical protein